MSSAIAIAVTANFAAAQHAGQEKLIPVRGVPFPQTTPTPSVTQPSSTNLTRQQPLVSAVTAVTPTASIDQPAAEPTPAPQPSSLLPEDVAARQAAAVAASVVPPEVAAGEISTMAGEYSFGNGFDKSCTLEISTDGRFLYKRCDCEEIVDQAAGKINLDDKGHVVLQPAQARTDWSSGTAPVLIPVSWGQRLYLVPHDDVLGFINEVNRGVEPVSRGNIGNYFLREGDWDRPVEGLPSLPEEWQAKILEKPLVGAVAGKDPGGRWIIDLGQNNGIYNGMELTAWSPQNRRFVNLRVTETGLDTSAVQLVEAPPMLSIQGWRVYSGVTPPPDKTQSANSQ